MRIRVHNPAKRNSRRRRSTGVRRRRNSPFMLAGMGANPRRRHARRNPFTTSTAVGAAKLGIMVALAIFAVSFVSAKVLGDQDKGFKGMAARIIAGLIAGAVLYAAKMKTASTAVIVGASAAGAGRYLTEVASGTGAADFTQGLSGFDRTVIGSNEVFMPRRVGAGDYYQSGVNYGDYYQGARVA